MRKVPYSSNKTFLVLIQKTKQPCTFNDYRPISLCNFAYKIFSKILTERLEKFMERIISPNQRAFVEGRWIAENTIIAHEVVHKIKKHKGNSGLILIKMDIKKAYDRLEWDCVMKALNAWGFSLEVQQIIRNCLDTVQYSLLLNGDISGTFSPSRGLRQGNLLSPFIFILCSELLTRLLLKEENEGRLHGIKVSRNAPAISHLMFADDLLMMFKANKEEVLAFKRTLDMFFGWFGQEANVNKSSILFSKNTTKENRVAIRSIIGFKDMPKVSVYLGNSLLYSRNMIKNFMALKDRISHKLDGWNRNLLSKAGKATLVSSVVQAIPTYSMSTFWVMQRFGFFDLAFLVGHEGGF